MTKEELNSDKVNYLIWRYLQESNYQETAVKLQAEWDIVDPQSLDFAPHVQSHALVHILQRGLLFHEAERRAAQARRQPSAANAVGFFGPVPPLSPPLAAEEDPINARKRTSEERPQQSRQASPAKRAKLSNGYESGIVESTPMDLDEQDTTDANSNNGHVYPSPEEIDFDQPPPPAPTTNGSEKATQAEKPYDLKHEAHCVSLAGNETDGLPSLTQCEWSPKDSSRLITSGIDMKPRNWKMSAASDQATQSRGSFVMEFEELLIKKAEISGNVTYVSWSTDGNSIALASDCGDKGTVTVLGGDRDVTSSFVSAGHPPIVALRWDPTDQYLLALTSPGMEDRSSWVTIYDLVRQDSVAVQLAPGCETLDAQWTRDGTFVVCDDASLIRFEHRPGSISKLDEFPHTHTPTVISYDNASGLLAIATVTGKLTVWDAMQKQMEVQAHDGQVTSLKWQPDSQKGSAILASSGEDKTVKLWRVGLDTSYEPLRTMYAGSGVLEMAFTPRGDFLAAATNGHVAIWDMSRSSTVPVACWTRGKEPGWQSPKQTNGHVPEEDQHSLKWDSLGLKLAYGVNSMLAIIEFDPAHLSMNGYT